MAQFPQRLFQARTTKGLTQEALARLVGITGQSISLMERGKMGVSSEVLLALSRELEVRPEWLFPGHTETPPGAAVAALRPGACDALEAVLDLLEDQRLSVTYREIPLLREEARGRPGSREKIAVSLRHWLKGARLSEGRKGKDPESEERLIHRRKP